MRGPCGYILHNIDYNQRVINLTDLKTSYKESKCTKYPKRLLDYRQKLKWKRQHI